MPPLPVLISQISNRNRRRNKEKKKLRETAPDTSSPLRTQQQQAPGRQGGGGGADAAATAGAAAEAATAEGSAASYFAGRKRQKGDAAGQQGLGLLMERGRTGGDVRGADDTMEFMEVRRGLVWRGLGARLSCLRKMCELATCAWILRGCGRAFSNFLCARK